MPAPLSPDLRQRVIDAYFKSEGSYRQLAVRYGVHFNSIKNWIAHLRVTGGLTPLKTTPGHSVKSMLNPEHDEIIRELVKNDCDATLQELANQFKTRTSIEVSASAISRRVQAMRLTRKKKTEPALEKETPENQLKTAMFKREVAQIDEEDYVFLDETGSNLAMTRRYGRSLEGTRCVDPVPKKRGGNVSLFAAISLAGAMGEMSMEGALDGAAFLAFVEHVLIPKMKPGQVLIMDNLSAHKNAAAMAALKAAGIRVLPLPPYSPELNPIEECFSKIKSILRSIGARTKEGLYEAMKTRLDN